MRLGTFLAHARRESRGGGARLTFFVACLAVGVAAVVSVASFSSGLESGIRKEARALLAADLAVSGRNPLPAAALEVIDAVPGAERTRILEMLTMVAVPAEPDGTDEGGGAGASRLTELKAVDGAYPYYGELELEPRRPLAALLDERSVVVGPELVERLGVGVGDELRIGGKGFEITAVVLREPDRVGGAFSLGPRIFLDGDGLERADLEQFGSRILYRWLVRLPAMEDEALTELVRSIESELPDDGRFRVELWSEAQPQLREGLRRTESYLGLAALLSLLVGGIGVAQTVRAWLAGKLDAIAVLKCLGYRPREVMWLYLGQTAALGLLASVVGIVLGVALQVVPATLLAEILPTDQLDPVQPLAWLRGLGLGLGVALLFSVPPLSTARRVPPIRVFRRSAEPLPPSPAVRWATAGVLVAGVFVLAWTQSRSPLRGLAFTGGLLAAGLLLWGSALGLSRLAARPRHRAPLWLRHGLSALSRPGASTVGAVVALGLGVLVVLAMFLVERGLSSELDRDLPDDAPTAFFIDIQPHQWPAVREILATPTDGAEPPVDSVPVLMARLESIDGRSTEAIYEERKARRDAGESDARDRDGDGDGGDDLWVLRREQRLTYLEELPEDNEIVAGELWSKPNVAEVSIEQDFADDLGVGVGSELVFDVQGVPVEVEVTSLRTVDWSTFGINFFLVVEPGVLDEAPQHRVAAARLSKERVREVQDALAGSFPNVTVIQIREVLERISAILRRLGLGVQVLGSLTVLAGLAILAGAVSAGAIRRGKEVALYKTLGMTRRQVVLAFSVEYALVGAVAGLIGVAGGTILAVAVLRRGMEIQWLPGPAPLLLALALTVALSVVAGLLASVGALQKRPVEVLRTEGG